MERPDLVLTHSNGGRFASLAAPGIPVVHIDAALPPASGEAVPMAPPAMLEHLTELGDDDGLLPLWSRWWPEDDLAEVLAQRVGAGRPARARAADAVVVLPFPARGPGRLGGATAGLPRVR